MERCAEVYKEDARRVLSIDELIVSIKMLMEVGTRIESDLGLFMFMRVLLVRFRWYLL